MSGYQMVQVVPHNTEAEQALLGTILYDNKAYERIDGALYDWQFYDPFHQRLFAHVVDRLKRGLLADPVILLEVFKDDTAFKGLGGFDYLATITERAPPSTTAPHYAAQIANLAARRQLIDVADRLRSDAQRGDADAEAVLASAEAALGEVASASGGAAVWRDGRYLNQVIQDKLAGKRRGSYVTTGYPRLDAGWGGLRRGRLSVLAGRPSMGKSAVGLEIARRVSRAGLGVGFFSLEMDEEELALRLGCAQAYDTVENSGPVYFDIQRDHLRLDDADTLSLGGSILNNLPFHFDDRTGLTPGKIVPAAKKLIRMWEKAKVAPGVIILDHLHLVKPDIDRHGNRAAEIGDVSGALRELAKETGVAVLALCQLNREVENRGNKDKRPQLSDLKWSGNIEEDANTITFIYRPEYYLSEPEDKDNDKAMMDYMDQKMKWEGRIQFLTRKNRGGPNMTETTLRISLPHNAMWED